MESENSGLIVDDSNNSSEIEQTSSIPRGFETMKQLNPKTLWKIVCPRYMYSLTLCRPCRNAHFKKQPKISQDGGCEFSFKMCANCCIANISIL